MHSKADASPTRYTGTSHTSVLSRVVKNLGWLGASTVLSAIASLIYLALTARTLGPEWFGKFALVMTYGELITNLVQFQSWKAVIGFGASHHEAGRRARVQRLIGYTASLDWLGAIAGSIISLTGILAIGPLLHWTRDDQFAAAWFATALLLTSGTTASGILRLRSRFDLQAYSEAVAQLARLVGCLVGWVIGARVPWFLGVWAVAALLQFLAQWAFVLALGERLRLGLSAMKRARQENRGLSSFMIKTNVSSSLSLFWMQCGTLIVGIRAGPVDAGGFRLAHRFSQAMMKPVEIGTKAIFPELARLVSTGEAATLRHVLLRVSKIAAMFGLAVVVGAGLFGRDLLRLIAGTRFAFAQLYLFPLCIAAAISVAGFALEPFLNAHLRAGAVLRTYVVGTLLYGALLLLLLPRFGAEAAAYAAIAGSIAIVAQMAFTTAGIVLSSPNREMAESDPQQLRGANVSASGSMLADERDQPAFEPDWTVGVSSSPSD